jgi:hemerythrin-like domain-containing protein
MSAAGVAVVPPEGAMEATDIFIEEHRVIERVLTALEIQARRMQAGTAVRAGFFTDAAAFFRQFTDGCHQRKEEEPFLLAMMDAGLSNQTGPMSIMLAEHELCRSYNREIEKALQALERGEGSARNDLIHNALEYAGFARQHIRRENEFLFPMASRLIPVPERQKLLAEMKRYERDETGLETGQQYHRLAETLEAEAAG